MSKEEEEFDAMDDITQKQIEMEMVEIAYANSYRVLAGEIEIY